MTHFQGYARLRELLAAVFMAVALLLLLGTLTSHNSSNAGNEVSSSLSFFHTVGRDIVSDSTGEKVAFRGVNLNGLEFGSFFTNTYPGEEGTDYFKPRPVDFNDIQKRDLNIIRVPFEWARLVTGWQPTDPLPTTLDPTYLGILDEVVQMAAERQIYVVLDMHDFLKYWSGWNDLVCVNRSPEHQQLLAHTWKLLADHFRNEPAVLGYDIMNEPVRQEEGELCGSCNWHAIAQSVVDAIRTVDTNHLIFVEGPNYALASDWPVENGETLFITDIITPPRIVYSPHVFFDVDNDSRYDSSGEETGPVGQWQYYVRDRLLPVIDWSIGNNVPIFVGETNVPCTADWADVLDHAFSDFFEPLHLSVAAWHYITPTHCPLISCPLNLLACPEEHQLKILEQYPGGVYQEMGDFIPTPLDSLIYDDERVNPWVDGSWGDVIIEWCAPDPVFAGNCSIRVKFKDNCDGVKFIHHYGLDTRRFTTLQFWIYLTDTLTGTQDFKFFTTTPLSDCNPGPDPVYPSYPDRPTLGEFLPSRSAGQWHRVGIPLEEIVDPDEPIINGIAFQNMGESQEVFYLDNIRVIINAPPASVTIAGPTTGFVQASYTFIATVNPITATQPITYIWQATEQSSATNTGGLSDTVVFTWPTTGPKTITVTATNSLGTVTDTHVTTIVPYYVYLPIVMRNHPESSKLTSEPDIRRRVKQFTPTPHSARKGGDEPSLSSWGLFTVNDGSYRLPLVSGTYSLEFIPPPATGLNAQAFTTIELITDTVLNVDFCICSGAWVTETVDSTGNVGADTSLALAPTRPYTPHISYRHAITAYSETLKYAWLSGTTWLSETVDSGGRHTSLALEPIYPYIPCISHLDVWGWVLKYACRDGITWTIRSVEDWRSGLRGTSLALEPTDPYTPHISYERPFGFYDLIHAYWNGDSWATEVVDDEGDGYSSLALEPTYPYTPHISYFDPTNDNLKYAWLSGTIWLSETVDSAGTVGYHTSLALDSSGNPHISYHDATNGDLKYAWLSGTIWLSETVDSTGTVGGYTSLALDSSGNPYISYYDLSNDDLKLARFNGTVWIIQTVDSGGDVGHYSSLALDQAGCPHISYYNWTNGDLKYAYIPPVEIYLPIVMKN